MRLRQGGNGMTGSKFDPSRWDALSPEEKDRIQREAAALEDPDTPWNTYQPSVWEKTQTPSSEDDD
jgi:hypothetical protein